MSAVRLCTCVLSAVIGAGLFPHTIDTAAAELPAINDIARRYGESICRLQKWWVRYEAEAKSWRCSGPCYPVAQDEGR